MVSFTAYEAISALYRYQIEIKIPQSVSINLEDILNNPARFISEVDAEPYPVHGVLASIEDYRRLTAISIYVDMSTMWSSLKNTTPALYLQHLADAMFT